MSYFFSKKYLTLVVLFGLIIVLSAGGIKDLKAGRNASFIKNSPHTCGNNVCNEPQENTYNCPQDCVTLMVFFQEGTTEKIARMIIASYGEEMVQWLWINTSGIVYTHRPKAEVLADEINQHPKVVVVERTKKLQGERTMIVFNYGIGEKYNNTDNCELIGWRGDNNWRTLWSDGGKISLDSQSFCFYFAWVDNEYIHFYMAKLADVTEGNVNVFDKMESDDDWIAKKGLLLPYSAGISEACLSPYQLSDLYLEQIIDQAIREHYPKCFESNPPVGAGSIGIAN